MTCRELVASLGELVDGELSGHHEASAARHFARCGACRTYAESYEAAVVLGRDAFQKEEETDLPEELVAAILAACSMPLPPTLFA
jgi:anti-sigma factor RsiW